MIMMIVKVVNSEKASRLLERENKFELIVSKSTDKESLLNELKTIYGLKVLKVNMMYTPQGLKKAIVTLSKEHTPDEIATKFGLVV